MNITRRGALLATTAGASAWALRPGTAAAQQTPSRLSEQQLGQVIQTALGISPEKHEQRYDFAFRAKMGEDDASEWELSMSAVLSRDGGSIWVMAWLDELPTSAADVPRTALLRLLAQNDKLGNGKFFAYIPANRRFVLQKVVPNENVTGATFRAVLQDLSLSVVQTYGVWSVASWTQSPTGDSATQSAANDSEFAAPVRR